MSSLPIRIFVSYSHKDEALRLEFETFLAPLKRHHEIEVWFDREIVPGAGWADKIDESINTAHIIILLLSPDFLASDYCINVETKRALERYARENISLIPIVLRPVAASDNPTRPLQALPTNGKPVVSWNNRDEAWLDVLDGLRKVIGRYVQKEKPSSEASVEIPSRPIREVPAWAPDLRPSIAVLPFRDLGSGGDNRYFSEGLAEEITSGLSLLQTLRIPAQTSAFAFRNMDIDIREIGAKLNVRTILEGSIRMVGNRVRVNTQLVDVSDGYQIWSACFNREMSDIFELQEDISRAIVDKLLPALREKWLPAKKPTTNKEAHSLYLMGRYYYQKLTREGLTKSRQLFEQAIALDPRFALPYVGLAHYYWSLGYLGFIAPSEMLPNWNVALQRALDLDNTLAEAYVSQGILKGLYQFEWPEAELCFQKALKLDPTSSFCRNRYAMCLLAPQGALEKAAAELNCALDLDPLSPLVRSHLGFILHHQRQFDLAIGQLQKATELDLNYYLAQLFLALTLMIQERHEEAIAAAETACRLSGNSPLTLGVLGACVARAGRTSDAMNLMEKLLNSAKYCYVPPCSIAWIYVGLRDANGAFEWFEKSYEMRDSVLTSVIATEPDYDFLRSDPRYHLLLEKMSL